MLNGPTSPPETLVPTAPSLQKVIWGDGEMAVLTRAFRWERTPLGPIAEWSDVLLITVNMLLASRQPMFLFWGADCIQFYNDAYRPSLGPEKHPSALGQRGPECWPEIWAQLSPQIDAALEDGIGSWNEDQLLPIYRNGTLEDSYWTYSYGPVRDRAGAIQGVLVACSETTGRVRAEAQARTLLERLQRSEERLKLTLSAANGVGTWDWDMLTDRVYADPAFAAAYGVDAESAREGVSLSQFVRNIHPDDLPRVSLAIERAIRSGEDFSEEYRLLQADSAEHWVSARGRCSYTADGTPLRFPGITVDITQRKLAEAAVLKSEKLAAVGRLASSIAHEINNPLESVTNLLYLAKTATKADEIQEYILTAETELRRASAITNQTLRFHKQSTRPAEIACEDLIGGVLAALQSRIVNSNIEVSKQKYARRTVMCFDGEIRQVLSNLVGNAIDAMHPDGGRLIVRSREGRDWTTGRQGLMISVADTGAGIPATAMPKIFEAFFTTKGIGGTGLGLWISHDIVERHRGRLRVRSSQRPGHCGTVFSLFLPFEAVARP